MSDEDILATLRPLNDRCADAFKTAGRTLHERGTFAERWHRGADGSWRIHRDLTLSREPDDAPA